jgi:hypothetical protein
MPRVKKNPEIPLFDFQTNPEKTLAASTIQSYKKHLNKITELTYLAHQSDSSKPIISTKSDLLNNAEYVSKVIQDQTDKRLVLCGIYSAVFYSLGRQNLDADPRSKPYVSNFQKSYYTPEYLKKIEEKKKEAE